MKDQTSDRIRAAVVFGPLGALAVAASVCTVLLDRAADPTFEQIYSEDLEGVLLIGGVGAIALAWSIVTLVRSFLTRPYPLRMPAVPDGQSGLDGRREVHDTIRT